MGRARVCVLTLGLLLALGGVVWALTGDRDLSSGHVTGREQAPIASASAGPSYAAGLTDGIYAVGGEIPPGVYATTVPAGKSWGCYWARLRSFGQPDSIIDQRNLEPGESARVVVEASDRGFKVSNGCTWHQAV